MIPRITIDRTTSGIRLSVNEVEVYTFGGEVAESRAAVLATRLRKALAPPKIEPQASVNRVTVDSDDKGAQLVVAGMQLISFYGESAYASCQAIAQPLREALARHEVEHPIEPPVAEAEEAACVLDSKNECRTHPFCEVNKVHYERACRERNEYLKARYAVDNRLGEMLKPAGWELGQFGPPIDIIEGICKQWPKALEAIACAVSEFKAMGIWTTKHERMFAYFATVKDHPELYARCKEDPPDSVAFWRLKYGALRSAAGRYLEQASKSGYFEADPDLREALGWDKRPFMPDWKRLGLPPTASQAQIDEAAARVRAVERETLLNTRLTELREAIAALQRAGYEYNPQAEIKWKPPVKKQGGLLWDRIFALEERIRAEEAASAKEVKLTVLSDREDGADGTILVDVLLGDNRWYRLIRTNVSAWTSYTSAICAENLMAFPCEPGVDGTKFTHGTLEADPEVAEVVQTFVADELVPSGVVVEEKPLGEFGYDAEGKFVKVQPGEKLSDDFPEHPTRSRSTLRDPPCSAKVAHTVPIDPIDPIDTLSDDYAAGCDGAQVGHPPADDEEGVPTGGAKCVCGEWIPNSALERHQETCHENKRYVAAVQAANCVNFQGGGRTTTGWVGVGTAAMHVASAKLMADDPGGHWHISEDGGAKKVSEHPYRTEVDADAHGDST